MILALFLVVAVGQAAEAAAVPAWANAVGSITMKSSSGGSCTYFQKDEQGHGWVVTNNHVVGRSKQGKVRFPNGESSDATVVWRSLTADVAVLMITAPRSISPIPLAMKEQMPSTGDQVTMVGYGGGGGITIWHALVKGRGRRASDIAIATNTISGDSGGGAFFNGRLAGVNWGGPTWGRNGPMVHNAAVSAAYMRDELLAFHGWGRPRKEL
jgi:S1-C subfamily serine protease